MHGLPNKILILFAYLVPIDVVVEFELELAEDFGLPNGSNVDIVVLGTNVLSLDRPYRLTTS